jgi:cellobiose phosphorylase
LLVGAAQIPSSRPGFKMTRTFRGKRVKIEVQNPSGVNQGLKSLTIDGVAVEG